MMQKLDLWLRSVWAFWDTHGTRLLGVAGTLHGSISAIVAVWKGMDSTTAAILLSIGAVLGEMTRARGTTNAARTQ